MVLSPEIKTSTQASIEGLADLMRDQLNALVICLSHSWGGLEQVAANDAVDIGALRIPVKLLCLKGSPIHEQLADRSEVTLIPIDFRPANYFDVKLRNELFKQFDAGVNLVHTHQTSLLGSIVPWLWQKNGIALVASRHIMNNHNKKDFVHTAMYRRLDCFVVMSQSLRKNVLDTHRVRERLVKVVNLGLDFNRFDPEKVDAREQRASWGADDSTTVIGLVGRIDPAKGQATFIRAAAGLLKRARPDEKLKFVIVGEETLGSTADHLEELKQMIVQFRLQDEVVFAGYQENIPEVMRAFDIFVMPSRQEAFGLVAIEAMAMGCPIVISSGGSAEEIVGHNEFGVTVRPEDAFDLQVQIRYLLDHPEIRAEMGRKGREHVKSHYDRDLRIQKTLEIYDRALRRRGSI